MGLGAEQKLVSASNVMKNDQALVSARSEQEGCRGGIRERDRDRDRERGALNEDDQL